MFIHILYLFDWSPICFSITSTQHHVQTQKSLFSPYIFLFISKQSPDHVSCRTLANITMAKANSSFHTCQDLKLCSSCPRPASSTHSEQTFNILITDNNHGPTSYYQIQYMTFSVCARSLRNVGQC